LNCTHKKTPFKRLSLGSFLLNDEYNRRNTSLL
jgi:hypothetical protein